MFGVPVLALSLYIITISTILAFSSALKMEVPDSSAMLKTIYQKYTTSNPIRSFL
jgi:hypothetical protein